MKTLASFVALGLACLAPRLQAIDFTARTAEVVEDDIPIKRMYFTEGADRIYYRPMPNWTRSCDAQSATFLPKDSQEALVKIQNAPVGSARIPFDEPGLASFRATARKLLPAGAAGVTQTSEAVNPVILQGWTSVEINFSYVRAAKPFSCSVLFINLDANRQVYLIVDAPQAEFEELHKTAYRTLASWAQQPAG